VSNIVRVGYWRSRVGKQREVLFNYPTTGVLQQITQCVPSERKHCRDVKTPRR